MDAITLLRILALIFDLLARGLNKGEAAGQAAVRFGVAPEVVRRLMRM
jgi:hypothetical protein